MPVFSMPDFAQDLSLRQYIISPSIDPLTDKNSPISDAEIEQIYRELGIPRDRKILLQVSRFDRFKNPVGVIEAYKIFKSKQHADGAIPTCLVLAGGSATDDPEGAQMKLEVEARAGGDPDIIILERPPTSHREINALQSGADIVIQNSSREGFGLVVTEALWKKQPVISTGVSGIKIQLLDGLTGLVAKTPAEMADRIEYLLRYPEVGKRIGESGHKHVKQHFLIPRQLRDYLRVIVDILKA